MRNCIIPAESSATRHCRKISSKPEARTRLWKLGKPFASLIIRFVEKFRDGDGGRGFWPGNRRYRRRGRIASEKRDALSNLYAPLHRCCFIRRARGCAFTPQPQPSPPHPTRVYAFLCEGMHVRGGRYRIHR